MKVKIGRDFYDKKNDTIYAKGEITDVKEETALWMIRHSLGYIIPNVQIDRSVKINSIKTERVKAIEESQDKMMRKVKTK